MPEDPIPPSNTRSIAMAFVAIVTLATAAYGLYRFSIYAVEKGDALLLSLVVLVGLALIIALMAGLATVYSFLGVQNQAQPLALPEGSVRALIAFSLVLMFVCLATFLYQGTKDTKSGLELAGKVTRVTAAQVAELRKTFVVVEEPLLDAEGKPVQDPGPPPSNVYTANYYFNHARSQQADDLAKQIFTTLATVFVSVVSFYFGSSTTSSGVGAGMKMAGAETKLSDKSVEKPGTLRPPTETLTPSPSAG